MAAGAAAGGAGFWTVVVVVVETTDVSPPAAAAAAAAAIAALTDSGVCPRAANLAGCILASILSGMLVAGFGVDDSSSEAFANLFRASD